MIRYMKRVTQIVVLTAVLVFSGLMVMNTDFMTEDAEAGGPDTRSHHLDKWYTPHDVCYYEVN